MGNMCEYWSKYKYNAFILYKYQIFYRVTFVDCHPEETLSTEAEPRLTMLFQGWQYTLLYLMLVSYNLFGQLNFWMSHDFYKGCRREGDIKKMSHVRIYAHKVQTEKPMAAVAAFLDMS